MARGGSFGDASNVATRGGVFSAATGFFCAGAASPNGIASEGRSDAFAGTAVTVSCAPERVSTGATIARGEGVGGGGTGTGVACAGEGTRTPDENSSRKRVTPVERINPINNPIATLTGTCGFTGVTLVKGASTTWMLRLSMPRYSLPCTISTLLTAVTIRSACSRSVWSTLMSRMLVSGMTLTSSIPSQMSLRSASSCGNTFRTEYPDCKTLSRNDAVVMTEARL